MLTNMINDDIRSRVDLTKFGKYIRIESLLLAQ